MNTQFSVAPGQLGFLAGALCLFTGVVLGIVFLGLKLLRLLLRGGRLFVLVSDLLFGLLCALVTFVVALAVDSGRLRLFQAVLEALGAWGAIVALDPLVNGAAKAFRRIWGWLGRLCRRVVRLFLRPAFAVGRALRAGVGKIWRKICPKRKKKSRRKRAARAKGRAGRKNYVNIKNSVSTKKRERLCEKKVSGGRKRKSVLAKKKKTPAKAEKT